MLNVPIKSAPIDTLFVEAQSFLMHVVQTLTESADELKLFVQIVVNRLIIMVKITTVTWC